MIHPDFIGKPSKNQLHVLSLDLNLAFGFFVPHQDFEVVEILEHEKEWRHPDESSVELMLAESPLDGNIRKSLMNILKEFSIVYLKLKGVNFRNHRWEFLFSYGDFHYFNEDTDVLDINLSNLLRFLHLPVHSTMAIVNALEGDDVTVESYYGENDEYLMHSLDEQINKQREMMEQGSLTEEEKANQLFRHYIPERLLPFKIRTARFFLNRPPNALYVRSTLNFSALIFVIVMDESMNLMHPIYHDWLSQFYPGNWKEDLEARNNSKVSSLVKDGYSVLESYMEGIGKCQWAFITVPNAYLAMNEEEIELWLDERFTWMLHGLDSDDSNALFMVEMHEVLNTSRLTSNNDLQLDLMIRWYKITESSDCCFIFPASMDDFRRIQLKKSKSLNVFRSINPDWQSEFWNPDGRNFNWDSGITPNDDTEMPF